MRTNPVGKDQLMEPVIVTRQSLRVVGLRIVTRPMSPEIPPLWPRFVQREHEITGVLEPRVSYGVMQRAAGGSESLAYLAGLSVDGDSVPVPPGMSAVAIPAGQYAVFEFPFAEIGPDFDFILNRWLPSSGLIQAASPMFERYGEAFDPNDSSSRMEVHVPVVGR